MFGYDSAEEFAAVPLVDHYYDAQDREQLREAAAQGSLQDFELRFKRKDGTEQTVLALRDITQLHEAEAARRRSEARNAAIIESALDCIITIDADGRVVEFNPAAEKTFGYTRGYALGREMAELIVPPSQREQHRRGLERHLSTGESRILDQRLELDAMRADGSEFPSELSITRIAHDGPPMFTGYLRDITERKQAEEQLTYRTFYDPLNELPNRTLFRQHVEHTLEHAEAPDSVAVLLTSIQDFRQLNDSLGHEAGDELLSAAAERVQTCLKAEDSAPRLADGEFAILLENIPHLGDGIKVAERIADQMNTPFTIYGHRLSINTHTGIALGGSAVRSADDLLRNAGTAMNRAEDAGAGSYVVYDEGVDERALEHYRLSNELAEAFHREELEICYRPRVLLESG